MHDFSVKLFLRFYYIFDILIDAVISLLQEWGNQKYHSTRHNTAGNYWEVEQNGEFFLQ